MKVKVHRQKQKTKTKTKIRIAEKNKEGRSLRRIIGGKRLKEIKENKKKKKWSLLDLIQERKKERKCIELLNQIDA